MVLCFSALSMLLLFHSAAFALPAASEKAITPKEMKEWDNGAKVTSTSGGTDSQYQLNVTANTRGLGKGYYSVYLYEVARRNVKAYDAFRFDFANKSQIDLKMNVTFTINASTSVTMTEASYAILESSDRSVCEVTVPVNGTISVPAGFDGTIYIPLSELTTPDGKSLSLSAIQSWGITTVLSENQQMEYRLGNIAFLSGSLEAVKSLYYMITLTGNNTVSIPSAGSTIEFYQAKVSDLDGNPVPLDVSFFLKDPVPGVTISEEGQLDVNSSCTASEVTVCANVANGANYGAFKVALQKGDSTVVYGIPSASSIASITTALDTRLNQSVWIIRVACVVLAVFLMSLFSSWFSEARANYSKIKNRLYHIEDPEEEEKP